MSPAFKTLSSGMDERVALFVSERSGQEPRWKNYNTLGFWDDRGLKVGIVYNNFSWPNIGMHVGARNGALWCRPEILHHAFEYPFSQLGCWRVTAPVLEGNWRSQRMLHGLGFTLEGRLRAADRSGQDVLLFGLLAEECRWLMKQAA